MIEIWGRRNSSNVMTAMWTLGELGLAYERRDVGGSFGQLDSAQYRAMNPNGVVPVIKDDGKIVWESNVIARYLAASYGAGTLWPTDPYARAQADQWMDWAKTTFYPAFIPVFFNLIRCAPDKQDMNAVRAGLDATAIVIAALEQQLQKHAYVAGDQFTMGDIPLGPMIYRYMNLPIERPALPAMQAWFNRLSDRPAYQKHAMIPFGESFDDWQHLEKASAGIQ